MRKFIVMILVLVLVLAMTIPASAYYAPGYYTPVSMPKVPDITNSVRENLKQEYDFAKIMAGWFASHPFHFKVP